MKILIITTLMFIGLVSKGQDITTFSSGGLNITGNNNTILVTSDYTYSGSINLYGNYNTLVIEDGVTLTVTASVYFGSSTANIHFLSCNSKLVVQGGYSGWYGRCEMKVYCESATNPLTASTSSYAGWCEETPLPVELVKLDCSDKAINWSTASEINNSHFVIEYSKDGITFESEFTILGQGNSVELMHYKYSVSKNGYYRLCQTDYDGTTERSKIIYCGDIGKSTEVKLVGRYDLLGQEIPSNFKGIVIEVYSDGTTNKILMQ